MKKIITVLTAVLLLCGMVFSMASCGSVNMDELKTKIDELETKGELEAECSVGEAETGSKAVVKRYIINTKAEKYSDREYLVITEYENAKLAKLVVKGAKLSDNYSDDNYDLQKKYNELVVELGDAVDELEEPYETVVKRKGNVVISGSKALYDKLF